MAVLVLVTETMNILEASVNSIPIVEHTTVLLNNTTTY